MQKDHQKCRLEGHKVKWRAFFGFWSYILGFWRVIMVKGLHKYAKELAKVSSGGSKCESVHNSVS